ncbi:MAG: hypothetical protein IJP66_00660, partial [Kiritimatiellae bacterium]|nr:hypothetical protein [Kiritimatiellia bacterium]
FQCGLVWFGAAVSIAEIQTGIDIAANARGGALASIVWAIVAGHIAGGLLLFAVCCIGARLRAGAMDCAKLPFGRLGAGLLAILNIVQLLGWTAVMVAQGADAASALWSRLPFPAAACAIGALVAAWIFIGLGGISKINAAAMTMLLLLTVYISARLLAPSAPPAGECGTSSAPAFWTVFELSAAMPLSWLPLMADYTKDARSLRLAPAVSAATYTIVSCWMFAIGLGCGLRFPGVGFPGAVLACGAAVAGLLVVVFSTVTTTFLDAYSAGESAKSIFSRIPSKLFAVAVAAAGTALAIFIGMDRYLDFLYLIASVFAPMAAVQIADWIAARGTVGPRAPAAVAANIVAWVAGVAAYHVALAKDCPVGATIPAMAVSAALAAIGGRKPQNG